jgi:hypothetical protein
LARYGADAKEAREMIRDAATRALNRLWPADGPQPGRLDPAMAWNEALYDHLQGLTPQDETQRTLQGQALTLAHTIGRARWLMFEQGDSSIPTPFLAVLVCWLAIIFGSFALYAPPNATVLTVLVLCALSIAGAIFLILELDQPYAGWIQLSSAPLRKAISQLGQ